MAKLSAAERNSLGSSKFAIPENRSYPIPDINHARDALARSSGKSVEPRVRAAVKKRFPMLDQKPTANK